MPACCVCRAVIDQPLYVSAVESLVTMLRTCPQRTVVHFCAQCGHLQTDPVLIVDDYYAQEYSILAESDEEDQLYQVVDGRRVFQLEHRLNTLLDKLSLPPGAQVLDFGCAKGAFLKRLLAARPDIRPYFFDVTDRYLPFWQKYASAGQWAHHTLPPAWDARFDLVCSFYVLEHVADPVAVIRQTARLLKPGGWLYFLVPNIRANSADLVVADHLQHYSRNSLTRLLAEAGLTVTEIDEAAHAAAFVVTAHNQRPATPAPPLAQDLAALEREYRQMAQFWTELADRVRAFESRHGDEPACIYGAGFYGTFIWNCLADPSAVCCFVDQNPYLQGRQAQGVPIVAPSQLDPALQVMYAGLNPAAAQSIIGRITSWPAPPRSIFYL